MKLELSENVPEDVQRLLAETGVRDEQVMPTAALLEAQPSLLGYYRLLLGISQKAFYRPDTGLSRFKRMEIANTLTPQQRAALPEVCTALVRELAALVRQLSPSITARDVAELQLLTLGSQFQGATNVAIGQQATRDVFEAIVYVVKDAIKERRRDSVVLENASQRRVEIVLRADPDVGILEEFDGAMRPKVAIEIKGGADVSNVHNRAGKRRNRTRRQRTTAIVTAGP